MRNHLHIPALTALSGMLAVQLGWIIILVSSGWLLLLTIRKKIPLVLASLSAVVLIFSYFYGQQKLISPENHPLEQEHALLKGSISSFITNTETHLSFKLKTEQEDEPYLIHYFLKEGEKLPNYIKYGAMCTINAQLTLPDQATNPGEFNYRQYLQQQGIRYQAAPETLEQISCSGSSPAAKIMDIRQQFLEQLNEAINAYSASWAAAMVNGDDSGIEESTVELFNRWGLSHILAISGMHVALLIGILQFIFIKLQLLTKKQTQIAIIALLVCYPIFAGGAPSVWRASLTVFLVLMLLQFNVKISVTDGISLIFLALLLLNPNYIYHIGFQFSFLVSLGLILSSKIYSYDSPPVFLLQTSLISQLVILPLQAAHFHFINPLSIWMNLIAIPYFTLFAIPFLFLIGFSAVFFPSAAGLLGGVFKVINELFITCINWLDQWIYFPLVLGEFPIWCMALYYTVLFYFMAVWEKKRYYRTMFAGMLLPLLCMLVTILPVLREEGRLTMLDIGQGDAFILELPHRKGVYVIDAGGAVNYDFTPNDKTFKDIIEPFLYARGISKIDGIFLSHEDQDHIGSAAAIIDVFDPKYVITSPFFDFQKLSEGITNRQRHLVLAAGQELTLKGFTMKTFSPLTDKEEGNANSLVLQMKVGGETWLFTGDMGVEEETAMLDKFPELRADVLKVGHHGSNTSTSEKLLEQLSPDNALISAGRNNQYGHPHQEVLDRLEQNNIAVWRTDEHGAVTYVFKAETGTFYPFLP